MSKLFSTQEIHIEISSKCTLKCPRCPRTELSPDGLNGEFSLLDFQRSFPVSTLTNIKRLIFCGDIGDPIYATEFLDIIQYIKNSSSTQIVIITNGSYKKTHWWTSLGALLTAKDVIRFSVDGWDNASNNLYRVNSNFESIIEGIKAVRASSECRIIWSTIYFQFNENKIEEIRALAESLGCDEFQTVQSTKFDGRYLVDGVDRLKPVNMTNVSKSPVYQTTRYPLNDKQIHAIIKDNPVSCHSWAKCLQWQKEMFINVDGLVFPCPWFNAGYQENKFVQKHKDKLNVKLRSLDDVLNDPIWDEFVSMLETSPLEVCKIKCKNV